MQDPAWFGLCELESRVVLLLLMSTVTFGVVMLYYLYNGGVEGMQSILGTRHVAFLADAAGYLVAADLCVCSQSGGCLVSVFHLLAHSCICDFLVVG